MKSLAQKNIMSRISIVAIFILFLGNMPVLSQTITVKISNIRGEKGQILVMAQAGEESKPVYGMSKPEKGIAIVRLKNVTWEKFDISIFHDENGNWKLDMNEENMPKEGYARKTCKASKEEEMIELKIYYPENE